MASSPEPHIPFNAETSSTFSYRDATEEEIIEDLTSRFILNLPDEELGSLERICFQVEQAHWYYEDFIREENPRFPSLPLKKFTTMMFTNCPVLQHWNHHEAFDKFMAYKTQVPVCGAIMLNETRDKCVLVKGWKSSSGWGFPKGKTNEAEEKSACAVREVLEETGYNLAGQINPAHYIEITNGGQVVTLFVVPGVPEDYPFRTKTRKEISKIEWFKLVDLPNWKRNRQTSGKFYLIAPFINPLKSFLSHNKPKKGRKAQVAEKAPPNNAKSPIPVPNPAVDSDAIQDSSSQSSSFDNIGPQTPSPQYTESTPAIVEDQVEPSVPLESLDPHFAGLLSKLTLSAASAPLSKPEPPPPIASNNIQLGDAQPQASTLPTTSSISTATRPIPATTPVNGERTAPRQRVPNTLSPVSEISLPLAASADASKSFDQAPVSPRSPMAHKSTTTDISPYLSRPAEVPMSARRLQQLALLESVAQESARRTPMLANGANNATNTFSSPPPIAMPSLHHPQALQPPIYNAIQGVAPPMPPNLMSVHSGQDHMMRSRTSQAFHRNGYHAPAGSMSMSQHQLLSLINGSRTGLSPQPLVPPTPMQNYGGQGMYSTVPRPFLQQQYMSGPPPPPPMNIPFAPPGPNTFNMDMNRPRPFSTAPAAIAPMAPMSSTNTLLSLLRLGPTVMQPPTIPEQAPPSHPLPPL